MHLSSLRNDTGGGSSIVTAFGLTRLIGSAALAIDVGSLYLDRRKLQGIADAAALAAAGRPGEEQAAAERIIAANCDCGIHIAELTSGTYTPELARPEERSAGKEGVRTCRSRGSPVYSKKKTKQ